MNESDSSKDLIAYLKHAESKLRDLIKCLPSNEKLAALRDTLFYAVFILHRCDRKNGLKHGYKSRSARNLRALQPRHAYALQTELLIPQDHFVLPGSEKYVHKNAMSLRDWDKSILSWYRRDRPHAITGYDEQRSLLHFAACYGSVDFIKRLLFAGVSVREDQHGLSPIMWACYADRLDTLRALDEHVKTINQISWMYAPDRNGWTPIYYAVHSKKGSQCFEYILQNYGVATTDKLGRTVLHHAALLGKLTHCKQILEKVDSTILNKVDEQNRTALHLATACGHGEVVQLLLTHRANTEICDEHGHSALTYARTQHLHFCLRLLTRHARSKENLEANRHRATDAIRPHSSLGKQWSQSASHLNRRIGCSSFDSTSDSLDPGCDLWTHSGRSQSWGAVRRKELAIDRCQKGSMKPHLADNVVPSSPSKVAVYMTPTGGPLYQTRENLTIQDEEESVPVNFVCPASPQKPHNAVQFVRGKSIKQPNKPVTVSAQVNGSTRQRTRPVSGIKKDPTYTQSTRPPSRLGAMTPHERPSTPCTPSLLVAKPAYTIVPKSPRPPSARYRQVQVADSVSVQAAQRFNSDTSDVDQFAEVHHVIRIPTRTYRTSIRGVRNAQTTRTVSERRAFDSVPKKTEPVKSCLVTRNRRSSCSSISDHDNRPFCDKSSVNATNAATVTATYGINRQATLVCEDRLPEGTADTAQPGRLLKRNQISWNLGSIKKFFNRRDKTGHEPAEVGISSPIHDQITRDYAEITMDLEKPSPKKYTTTMKLKDGLPKNVVGPAIRQTLLTPSVDHLTRRSSIRSVRR